jgi:tRNA(Ile)-lysidine synthase
VDIISANFSQLEGSKQVLVGVSGGPDSICLLHLVKLAGFPVTAAHYNHMLRSESDDEARGVAMVCEKLGVDLVTDKGDVESFATRESLSIETAARVLRYQFIFRQAEKIEAQAVLVGHHADDQIETILLHLVRGSGPDGLIGMRYLTLPNEWSGRIPLVRPLLKIWRSTILDYLQSQDIPFFIDKSNADRKYVRNKIRHELIPLMETINPQVKRSLWKLVDILSADIQIIDSMVQTEWERIINFQNQGYIGFERDKLLELPVSIKRRLIRKALSYIKGCDKEIYFDETQRAVNWLDLDNPTGRVDLADGIYLMFENEYVWIVGKAVDLPTDQWPQLCIDTPISLNVPGTLELNDGWALTCDVDDFSEDMYATIQQNVNPYQAWMDCDSLRVPVKVRRRNPGDRIQLDGLQGHSQKVSDLMVNNKVPKRARNNWPLVESAGTIAWIPAIRFSEPFRVTKRTNRIVHFRLTRED